MKDLFDLFDDFLANPEEKTVDRLIGVCNEGIKEIDDMAARFGLTEMLKSVKS